MAFKQKHYATSFSARKACGYPSISVSALTFDHDLPETAIGEGAKVSEHGIIQTFDNDKEALDAFDNGIVVSDLSHFGLIRVSGDDRLQFLHNQSTANFESLREGQGLFD